MMEIKKYPKLTDVAAWRDRTKISAPRSPKVYEYQPHYGGYYTQEQIRDIVQYAKERFIEILPEIEMPGHCGEAIMAYPWLGCSGVSHPDAYCPGKEEVFKFNEDVLSEVMQLFPYKYIHIGGDEVRKDNWKKCKDCQARMSAEGLENVEELQSYFIKRIEKFLLKNNKRLIGWDEILEGGLSPEATVMCWRKEEYAVEALKQGHDVIMTPTSHCYFDYYQGDKTIEPLAIGGLLPLEKVYSYNPTPSELTPEQRKHILGVQCCLWTEYIRTTQHAEYMAYPRTCALAEVAWTEPAKKNYNDFVDRLKEHLRTRLYNYGVNYRRLDE